MYHKKLVFIAALALSGCAAGQPFEASEEARAAQGDAAGISTSATAWPASQANLLPTTLEQCARSIETGSHDDAALRAVGYETYKPSGFRLRPLPDGYEAIPRVEVVGPFAVEHKRTVRAFFEGEAGCTIRSMDTINPAEFLLFFTDRGYDIETKRRGFFEMAKDGKKYTLSIIRKIQGGSSTSLFSQSIIRVEKI